MSDDWRSQIPPELARMFGISPSELAAYGPAHMAAGSPVGEARGGATGAASGRTPLEPQGEPLPGAATPAFTQIDRWTMLELWARGVPPQYAKLLRAPVLPGHPGRDMRGQLA